MRRRLLPALFLLSLWPDPAAWAAGRFAELFQRTSPAVVTLYTFEQQTMLTREGKEKTTSSKGVGSGVVIAADGKILTAAHVVHLADAVHVEFKDGSRLLGKVLASDPASDVALVQVPELPPGAAVAALGDTSTVRVGDEVCVIGAPYGIGHSLSTGVVSGRRTAPEEGLFGGAEFFQTDAAVNQGNSGGPLFNLDGEVIGIVSHILSRSGGFEGMGFAVTVDTARRLLLDRRGLWSGVQGKLLSPEVAAAFNLPQPGGFLVERVAQGSVAHEAGVRGGNLPAEVRGTPVLLGGDIILAVAGIEVGEGFRERLHARLDALEPGVRVPLEVLRAGQLKGLLFTVPERY
ncbi:MAG TPA: trypsin-like peptidase domain-containing protein [Gammaproteobacteria bacterium]